MQTNEKTRESIQSLKDNDENNDLQTEDVKTMSGLPGGNIDEDDDMADDEEANMSSRK